MYGITTVVIYLDTFLELVKRSQGENIEVEIAQDLTSTQKWSLTNLITSAKKVLKEFGE